MKLMPAQTALALATLALAAIVQTSACTPLALQPTTSSGLIVYSKEAARHTARVQLPRPPEDVYAGMLAVVGRVPEWKIVTHDDRRFSIEAAEGTKRLGSQATDLGRGETLLFIWADAGESGQSGRDLALRAVELLCAELRVECSMEDL